MTRCCWFFDKAGISAIAGDELSIRCLDSEVEVSMPYESEVRLLNSMGVCLKTEKFIRHIIAASRIPIALPTIFLFIEYSSHVKIMELLNSNAYSI